MRDKYNPILTMENYCNYSIAVDCASSWNYDSTDKTSARMISCHMVITGPTVTHCKSLMETALTLLRHYILITTLPVTR